MNLRQAFRILTQSPATTAIIVLTLALCIGANTAIFSVVDATLLRPLPYPDPYRLIRVVTHYQSAAGESDSIGQDGRTWEAIRDHATFLDSSVFGSASGVNMAAAGQVQYVKQQRVGAGFFRVLGISPLVGREFTPEEDRPGGPPLTVLSFALWRRVFRQDPAAVGQTLLLRGEPYTIIGVMPESFQSSVPADLWTPLKATRNGEGGGINYRVVGRLKPGVTWAAADGQMESVGAPLMKERGVGKGFTARLKLVTLQQGQTQDLRKPVLILWAAVGLVLLIGCANVASLLLARSAARSREIATRMALGGGRGVIIRQLMTEALVLALIGGAAGILVGYFGLAGLKALAAKTYTMVESARLDGRVLLATGILSLFVSLLAGIFPALEAGAVDLRNALSDAGGRGIAGRRKRWSRKLLVAGEIAIAVLLLIGAGLLIRTVAFFYQLRPGFDPNHVISASFSLQDARYKTAQRVNQLFDAGLERMRSLPGVEAAGVGLSLPYEAALNTGFQRVDGPEASNRYLLTNFYYITPGYLEALRIPVLSGRAILPGDTATTAPIVLVNQSFVKQYLSRQAPVGSHLDFGKDIRQVVGVVGDVQQSANYGEFAPLAPIPAVYIPATQTNDSFLRMVHTWFPPSWVVRAQGAPADAIRSIQNIAAAIDPLVPIAEFRTLDDIRATTLSTQRFQATLLGSLSALALILAVVGIYGLMSQSVVERRRELGIRIAIGATLSQAIREAILPGLQLALAGVAAGCVLAGLSTRVLRHLIWGVSTSDPATYVGVAMGLLLVAATASLLPALRISRLNPADTLREE
ncbi:MAG TPA: ABC transporter permease [Bryobacteraceae bacterium]|nr:ABC transporter permease [Bryobacteraceae bacterium]